MQKQVLTQKLLQKLSPQQIQLMKLLQVPTAALEQRIKEEIQENPALEEGEEEEEESQDDDTSLTDELSEEGDENTASEREDIDIEEYIQDEDVPYYKTSVNNSSPDDERREIPMALSVSFQEMLTAQLGMCSFDDHQYLIAEQIIGSIDDDGYFRRPPDAIANDLAMLRNITTNEQEVQEVLKQIQTFDPPGTGARNLQECLLLQLMRKNQHDPAIHLATKIIGEFMEEFSKKHYDKIEKQLQISEGDLKKAMHEILRLNPRPGNSFADTQKSMQHVIPDFILQNIDGVLELNLNSRNAPDLKVSKTYLRMLEEYAKDKEHKKVNKDAIQFVKQKLDSAKWFIDAVNQRQQTLLTTMNAILDYQREYFLEGDETKMKPMILKDIADRINMDISTVSRVANSKYIQTHFGTFLLKSFFSEGLQTDSGEEVSSREVKKYLAIVLGKKTRRNPLPTKS